MQIIIRFSGLWALKVISPALYFRRVLSFSGEVMNFIRSQICKKTNIWKSSEPFIQ